MEYYTVEEATEKIFTKLTDSTGWKFLKSQRSLKKTFKDLIFEILFFSSKWNASGQNVEINAEIIEQIILMKEATLEHAANGRIVVEMFENSPVGYYDAILMDVRMPEMDGLEATASIRALDRPDAGTIPIIALTANAFDEDVQRSLQVGMNAHLSKPVEPENLYQTLEELIS